MARIAILGAGAVGTALAKNWTGKGHEVRLGVRTIDSESARTAADACGPAVIIAPFVETLRDADIVVLALPWDAVEPVLSNLDLPDGIVLIDATNPLGIGPDGFGLLIGHDTSGGERVAEFAPGARVVKTLNQIGAEIMADPTALPVPPVMFVAGDDDAARAKALDLVTDLGFDAQDFGPLKGARLLEAFAMTWIHFAILRQAGRGWGFARVEANGTAA